MNGISSLNTSSLGGARVELRMREYSQGQSKRNKTIPVLWAGLGANLTNVRLLRLFLRCYDFTLSKRNDINGLTMRVGGALLRCYVF
jgi:hypothetical protein